MNRFRTNETTEAKTDILKMYNYSENDVKIFEAKLKQYLGKSSTVAIVGTQCNVVATFLEKLQQQSSIFGIANSPVAFFACAGMELDVEKLQILQDCNAVLVVEQIGTSKHADITVLLAQVSEFNSNILGTVLLAV